jgi:hypothetical protein
MTGNNEEEFFYVSKDCSTNSDHYKKLRKREK